MRSNAHGLASLLLAITAGHGIAAGAAVFGGGQERSVPMVGTLAETLMQVGSREKGPLWLTWEVAAVPALGDACCLDRDFQRSVCYLERRQQSWGSSERRRSGGGHLQVLVRWAEGKVQRVRAVSGECGIDTGGLPFVHVEGVSAAASVAYLASRASTADRHKELDETLSALAFHDHPAADAALQKLAARGEPLDRREKALFWMGQVRGEEGGRYLAGVARTDPDPDIREKAVFSLSQSEATGAVTTIVEVARRDSSVEVRGQALFWLAQTGAAVAPQVILESLDKDPPVRDKAVFAITQLKGGESVPLLVRLVRERRDPEIRKQALFWLGQSSDPRAFDFLEKILDP